MLHVLYELQQVVRNLAHISVTRVQYRETQHLILYLCEVNIKTDEKFKLAKNAFGNKCTPMEYTYFPLSLIIWSTYVIIMFRCTCLITMYKVTVSFHLMLNNIE
jgi:hypothetical protein